MYTMRLDTIIRMVQDSLCEAKRLECDELGRLYGPAIKFNFRLSGRMPGKEETINERIEIVITGNTNVFVKFNNDTSYLNTCNHDSCWMEDGISSVINQKYFVTADYLNNRYNMEVAPVDMYFDVWPDLVKSWELGTAYLEKDGYYKKKLVSFVTQAASA